MHILRGLSSFKKARRICKTHVLRGNLSFQMVKRYAHISEGHTANVVERMNERFI